MGELLEYFTRHYTLVIDNTQEMYEQVTRAAVRIVRDSDITAPEWTALSARARVERFAEEIGEKVLEIITGWYEESTYDRDHPGALLTREIMIFSGQSYVMALGEYYIPEDADIVDLLPDGDDEDEDDSAEVNG